MLKSDRFSALLEDLCHGEFIALKTRDKSVSLFFQQKVVHITLASIWITKNGTE